jgi:2-desacetyl-2-hydroxyethyl bacteriochlorophyllide A dehydrogenase
VKAITFQGEKEVRVEDVPKPEIKDPRDVLVKVTLGAICGSDLHAYHSRIPVNQGAVLGHEFVGVVEEAGPEVKRFKPGDRVVPAFYSSCGHCNLCRKGWYSQCDSERKFGFGDYFGGLGGGQSEYCVVPNADSTMEPIPAGMTDEQAIFVGDILATGYFGAERAEIRPGDTVAVVGAGPVGLMAVMCANLFGPARVFAIDMVDTRLELAQGLGAIPINARENHPVEAIKSATREHGADASIECVGLGATIETAIHSVRGGGTISMVGVPEFVEAEFPYMRVWMKDLTFRSGQCNVQPYMRLLLDLIEAGKLDPASVISHRMKLDEGERAYEMFDAREATKIVLEP